MPYAGFTPLCGSGAPAAPPGYNVPARAPPAAASVAPRRSDWRAESGGVQVGASTNTDRSSAAELRRTYLDADEVAMMRAMARIDGDDAARRKGNQFSQSNRSRIQAQLEAKAAQGLVPADPHAQHLSRKAQAANYTTISQRGINVPRVGLRSMGPRPPPIAYVPHRPTQEEIAMTHNNYERPLAPLGVPTRSSDERKDELATKNQFFGKSAALKSNAACHARLGCQSQRGVRPTVGCRSSAAPEEVLAEGGGACAGAPRHGRRARQLGTQAPPKNEQEELRGQIADEVAERQAFLDEMRAMGKAGAFEAQINAQIAERMDDLRRLDRLE